MTDQAKSAAVVRIPGVELGEIVEQRAGIVTYRGVRQSDGRAVLVRTLRPGLRTVAAARAALRREHETLRKIDHPALPTLLEVIRDEPHAALVLADHGGHRLDAVLDRVPRLDAVSATAIAAALASALYGIHRAGEVHAAVRADLVELTEQGAVYLHGVGRAGESGGLELSLPKDLAPEQIIGNPADAQTDVFLLGSLLYRMLAGSAPFDHGEGGVSQRVRHGEPQPLGRATSLPAALERVVDRCLAKRPPDRYPDMASLAAALERLLRAETALPREHLVAQALASTGLADAPPPPRERGVERGLAPGRRSRMRSSPFVAAVGAGAVIAALGGWLLLRNAAPADGGPRGVVERPARLRILARPWAEVDIDGKLVDTTPIGQPIDVAPGKHKVVFRHPNAPSEEREVEVVAGQTVLLDVDMRVTRPVDAGAPRAADAGDASAEDEP
jgi:eukaryotic-like serine/threonine-protein kinase